MPSLARLGFRTLPGSENVRCSFVFCFFLSVTLLSEIVCECRFAINAFEYANDLSMSKRAMFVVVHSRSTLSLQRWAEPPQDDEFEKNGKIGGSRFKGYAMN